MWVQILRNLPYTPLAQWLEQSPYKRQTKVQFFGGVPYAAWDDWATALRGVMTPSLSYGLLLRQ